MESFIEHQDACNMGRLRQEPPGLQPQPPPACLSRTASSPSPSSETNLSTSPWPSNLIIPKPLSDSIFFNNPKSKSASADYHNLDLQLSNSTMTMNHISDDNHSTHLQLSIGSSDFSSDKNLINNESTNNDIEKPESVTVASKVKEQAREQLRLAMAEKAYAEEAREAAKRQIELAEQEFANAKKIRQQAQAELDRAQALKAHAIKQINSTILRITCHACKQQFQARNMSCENSMVLSHEGDVDNDHHRRNLRDHHLGRIVN